MSRFKFLHIILIALCCTVFQTTTAHAQKDPIEGYWLTEDGNAKIWIYLAKNGKYYGKIAWMKEPNDVNGNPKLDKENPKEANRKDPILGLLLLKGFEKDGDDEYNEGTVYDPKNGKTYSCTITLKSKDKLGVRGYVGVSLLGRTTTWTRTTQ